MFKYILLLTLLVLTFSQDLCPQSRLNECETDITKAYQVCDKAAKQKGQDQDADINCIKYFVVSRKQCWPCVCQIAKNNGWKIKGCDLLEQAKKIYNLISN